MNWPWMGVPYYTIYDLMLAKIVLESVSGEFAKIACYT